MYLAPSLASKWKGSLFVRRAANLSGGGPWFYFQNIKYNVRYDAGKSSRVEATLIWNFFSVTRSTRLAPSRISGRRWTTSRVPATSASAATTCSSRRGSCPSGKTQPTRPAADGSSPPTDVTEWRGQETPTSSGSFQDLWITFLLLKVSGSSL